jgi:hypothetical protein
MRLPRPSFRVKPVPAGMDEGERSLLSLVFRRDGDRWLLVQDQNTPIARAAG